MFDAIMPRLLLRLITTFLIPSLLLANSECIAVHSPNRNSLGDRNFSSPFNTEAISPWTEFTSHPIPGKRSEKIRDELPNTKIHPASSAQRVRHVSIDPSGPVMLTGSGKPDIGIYSLFWALHVLNGKDIDGKTPRVYDSRTRLYALANLFIRIRTAGIAPVEEVLGTKGLEIIVSEWEHRWLPEIQLLGPALEKSETIAALVDRYHQANVHYLSEIDPSKLLGRRVLVRDDFNDVHIEPGEADIDDIRLNAAKETLEFLRRNGARIIVATHAGRPTGEGPDPRYPVAAIGAAVGRLLGIPPVPVVQGREAQPGHYAVVTDEIVHRVAELRPGDILVLDNFRFDWRERSTNPSEREGLAADLAAVADLFVLDGFPISHRPDASVIEMHKVLPSVAGFWQEREMRAHYEFLRLIESPGREPMAAIFGGSKPDKWPIIQGFVSHLRAGDKVLIGGLIADYIARNHFLEITRWREEGLRVILTTDSIDGKDIGSETLRAFLEELQSVRFVYWNGPVGAFETTPYQGGSYALAQELKEGLAANRFSHVFVSGGETAFVVKSALGLTERTRHSIPGLYISTGGGTSTDFFAFGRNIGLQSLWGISDWYRRPSQLITDLSPFLIKTLRPWVICYGLVFLGLSLLSKGSPAASFTPVKSPTHIQSLFLHAV